MVMGGEDRLRSRRRRRKVKTSLKEGEEESGHGVRGGLLKEGETEEYIVVMGGPRAQCSFTPGPTLDPARRAQNLARVGVPAAPVFPSCSSSLLLINSWPLAC